MADKDMVQAAIDELPANEKRAVLLYGWGFTQQEVKDITGIDNKGIFKIMQSVTKRLLETA